MRCPYCAEEIKDEAAVCKHCQRDLFVARRLLNQIEEMGARLALIEDTAEHAAEHAAADAGSHAHHAPVRHHGFGLTTLESFALTYIALVVAHFLIVVQFDLKLIFVKFMSIGVSLIFGLLYRESDRKMLSTALLLGLTIAVTAIPTMLAVVSKLDNVPFLPKDAYEWREIAFHSASIGFGFLTGVIIRHTLIAIFVPNAKPNKFIESIARFVVEQFGDGKPKFTLKAIRSMVSSILGASSAIISIVTGLWEYLK